MVNHIRYSVFGVVLSQSNAVPDNRYFFTGREFDVDIDLYYYRARYYDARTARFISVDPEGFAAGDSNLYRYVFNRPADLTDPSGRGVSGFMSGIGDFFNDLTNVAIDAQNGLTSFFYESLFSDPTSFRSQFFNGLTDNVSNFFTGVQDSLHALAAPFREGYHALVDMANVAGLYYSGDSNYAGLAEYQYKSGSAALVEKTYNQYAPSNQLAASALVGIGTFALLAGAAYLGPTAFSILGSSAVQGVFQLVSECSLPRA